ncbi:hypothetical protein MOSE0_K08636 [Monosporozyma servazzii]
MFTKLTISLMERLLQVTDNGLKLTKKFNGNILVIGGGSNEIIKKLCDSIFQLSTQCTIYHFNNTKPTTEQEKNNIANGYKYIYIYCNLDHINGFNNAIDILNRKMNEGKIQFDYYINLTLLNTPPRDGLFLNIISFQTKFNESVINVMKGMKYVLETNDTREVYVINFSFCSTIDSSYKNIDYLVCGNCINQFHDSLSSEIEGKCLLIYLPDPTNMTRFSTHKILKFLKQGYDGEHYIESRGINSILNETYHLLHDWA